jgi:Predicted Zn-dependent peptidases
VSYCGFTVNAGTRDERPDQYGLAHFVEHMLFKGTGKRKSWHILNRMERVGGEINAYTTKEETAVYSVCMSEDVERAMELLGDLVFHSRFPSAEIEKEKEVVGDEINSYLDTPSELIFDEFENRMFDGSELGHGILGEKNTLDTFTTGSCREFVGRHYTPGNMVFFFYGNATVKKVIRLADKYFSDVAAGSRAPSNRVEPAIIPASRLTESRNLHQTHVMIGAKGYSLYDKKRIGLYMINNILGGPGMNSRLNLSLREKHGLVYTVESGITSYTDTGIVNIYFGCDEESREQCIRLVNKEIRRLRDNRLSTSQFASAVKQWKGQLGISTDNRENRALSMGKAFLRYGRFDSLEDIYQKIDVLTPSLLQEIANEVFDEKKLFGLIFR